MNRKNCLRIFLSVLLLSCTLCGCMPSGLSASVPSTAAISSTVVKTLECEVQLPAVPLSIGKVSQLGGAVMENIRIHSMEHDIRKDGLLTIRFAGENTNGADIPSLVSFNWVLYDSSNCTVQEGYYSAGSLMLGEKFSGEIQIQIPHSGTYRFRINGSNLVQYDPEVDSETLLGVRILMFSQRDKAQQLLDEWYAGDTTEEQIVRLMKHHMGPGELKPYVLMENTTDVYYISPGALLPEIDAWCFADGRAVGDVAIIEFVSEHVPRYALCYISSLPKT